MAQTLIEHIYHLKGGEQEAVEYQNPFLERREPIVVFCKDGITRLKVGDGEHNYNELDFITNVAIDVNDIEGLQNILDELDAQIKVTDNSVSELKAFVDNNCVTQEVMNNKVEELTGALASYLEENYLTKNDDKLVGKKTDKGGEIFNDYEQNEAMAPKSFAAGLDTVAGTNVYKIVNIDTNNLTIELDTDVSTVFNGLKNATEYEETTSNPSKTSILLCSYRLNLTYDYYSKVVAFEGNTITVDVLPTLTAADETALGNGTGVLWIPRYPELGNGKDVLGEASFVGGRRNKSSGKGSVALGYDNITSGEYGFVAGFLNQAGALNVVGGTQNLIYGTRCIAAGAMNFIERGCSTCSISGYNNRIYNGQRHFVTGGDNVIQDTTNVSPFLGNFIAGSNNKILSNDFNTIFGRENTISYGECNLIAGHTNTSNGPYNLVSGKKNAVTSTSGTQNILAGTENKTTRSRSLIVGTGHNITNNSDALIGGKYSEDVPNALLILGNGSSSSRSNAFVAKKDGSIIIKGTAPSITLGTTTFTEGSLNNKADKSYVDGEIQTLNDQLSDAGQTIEETVKTFDNRVLELENKLNNGLVLTDNVTNINYRVYIENGKLQLEEVTE